jgi:hypothetical protein
MQVCRLARRRFRGWVRILPNLSGPLLQKKEAIGPQEPTLPRQGPAKKRLGSVQYKKGNLCRPFNKKPGGFMTLKTQFLIGLIVLSAVDTVIPVPIIGLALIFVLLQKLPWFQKIVNEFYQA